MKILSKPIPIPCLAPAVKLGRGILRLVSRLYDYFIPPRCYGCGIILPDSHGLCGDCWRGLDFIVKPWCSSCGLPFPYHPQTIQGSESLCPRCSSQEVREFSCLRAVLVYNDASRALILPFKHGDRIETVRLFARWLVQYGGEALVGVDIIAAVPLHPLRLWRRRYNQAALIAWEVGRLTGIRVLPDLLVRRRATRSQGEMTRTGRQINVAGAFKVKARFRSRIENKTILVIDDVMTTGATLNEVARVLSRQRVKAVNGLVVARVLLTR
ncbi:MAG: ComF family protein [Candidatus Pacebacteria bacterium]|nr:ComF family protein [Candidatus Paceibacterota bacterium]